MKNFLTKLIYIILLFCILLYGSGFIIFSIKSLSVNKNLESISKFECLIIGDSHMQRINPVYFEVKTKNIASSGEHFYFTYSKLLKIIKNKNHKIKTIITGISPLTFGPKYSDYINKNTPEGKYSLENYLYFIEDFNNFFINKFDLFSPKLFNCLFKEAKVGGLVVSENQSPNQKLIDQQLNRLFPENQDLTICNKINSKYLLKIDSMCHVNNIKLIIINPPLHKDFKKGINNFYNDCLKDFTNSSRTKHYLDFNKENINPNLMSDGDHLNSKGAEVYSKKINEYIMNY